MGSAGTMNAEVRYAGDELMVGLGPGNTSLVMDTKGDRKSAPSPMEALLMSVAGCTMVDVVSIMEKKRQPLSEYRIEISGERREEHPRAFTKMHLKHIVKGEKVEPDALARAIELSEEKYCSVAATIRPGVEITTSFEIL
jgi:putative redox protein